jgi:hypothetical protein
MGITGTKYYSVIPNGYPWDIVLDIAQVSLKNGME